ncbi:hypothetical protein YC2023_102821 [Brassica napus]|uniref:Yip1 domain-containing protein n=2 Tax=Brassica TaxID=3705 RepID=A0A3P6FIH9_BRAOL|nr:unnamed protein product [Brassica napus]VDD57823.1 unnamed protein product [Brassica oleracea]
MAEMYNNNMGPHPWMPMPQPNPFGNAFSGLIRSGLGSSSEGLWTRISEPVGGRLSYKPPIHDILVHQTYTFPSWPLALISFLLVSLGLYGKLCFHWSLLGKIIWGYSYYVLIPWTCLCTGVLLVKTMKRVLFAEARSYDSSRKSLPLDFLALAQFPLLIWLGNISVDWLF